ncbi:hypothetical protein [Burkholderia pyrrocinia]|uniref:hypothetical protein n=1 Tax=Burkholderia pyrrocinia TaxID=60550 RepID=UPI001589CE86|nr:hypothetical protein [Burkholderia pyrrocinia]
MKAWIDLRRKADRDSKALFHQDKRALTCMVRSMVCMVFELVRRLFEECATTCDKRSDIGVCILFMWRHLCAPAQMAVVDPWSIANTLLTERGGPGGSRSGASILHRGK